ncbi:T9SS type A sorting domain-containing protein [Seonamhaeicola sp. NFXS20]|uniref:T9SS type A sorting domain-containing protein n=1 Tax=Seonamhaeicola sp. NFXS20 TaxID=2816959 RepID=UPI003B8DAE01
MKKITFFLILVVSTTVLFGQTQIGEDIDGEIIEGQSADSVSLSEDGTIMAIGVTDNNGNGEDSGHVRVFKYNGTDWDQIGGDIDGEAAGDSSGRSVSLSADGTILAIGAIGNDGNGEDSGHVRVFKYNGTNWDQIGGAIEGEAAGDFSGVSVSLSEEGTIVAIGATGNDENGVISGHVRVFEYNGSGWAKIGPDIDGEALGDQSGVSVSLSADGTIVAIGAIDNDGNGSGSGHVRVYQYSDDNKWTKIGDDIDGEAVNDHSGRSVSLSADGSIVAIGANDNDGNGSGSGHVRVYQYKGDKWDKIGNDIDGKFAGDGSGFSVSLFSDGSADGSIVAIGARFNDDNGPAAGHVRVFEYSGSDWSQIGGDIDGEAEGDQSGYSVSLSAEGTILAIGAIDPTGFVRVFENIAGDWTQIGAAIDGEAADDESGTSVSLSADGTIMAIGAPENDGNGEDSGHVRVFQNINNKWTQIGGNIDGEAADDESGTSVSLSADGTIMAIGAPENDGNGEDSGHVRVFKYNGTNNWDQIGEDINGKAAGDFSGVSVSLSADGTILAIGAPGNDGNGDYSGHVRVFKYNGTDWDQIGEDIDGVASLDSSGRSVSLSADGTILAIGAPGNDGNGDGSGHVRVFKYNGTDWPQIGEDIDGVASLDSSGRSVSLSADGTILAIGAPGNDGNGDGSGHVRVFKYNGTDWPQIGDDIVGVAANDFSGTSVSLSADGSILAIGAPEYFSGSGYVRVFQYTDKWNQIGVNIDGEAEGDQSGTSVSLSADGTILAIGAPRNDGGGDESGHVRVFNLATTVLGVSSFESTTYTFNIVVNKAAEQMHVYLPEDSDLKTINLYSLNGKYLYTGKSTVLPIQGLSKGVYIVEVVNNLGRTAKKVVIP